MADTFRSFVKRLKPSQHQHGASGFATAPEAGKLFPPTDPAVDGDDCLRDCDSCTTHYPAKFSIDESDKLYGFVKGWETHLVVATGKTDWVRDVADEKGSIMEAVERKSRVKPHGRLMLSASNMPVPHDHHHSSDDNGDEAPASTVLLLPAFRYIDGVKPSDATTLVEDFVNTAPTNTEPVGGGRRGEQTGRAAGSVGGGSERNGEEEKEDGNDTAGSPSPPLVGPRRSWPTSLPSRPCPHRYLVLLCSQKTRDARCGQSAPLLRKEFERHLRPLGLYRDMRDERPGGVGVYFISHVGGHKYSANVMIYRKAGAAGTLTQTTTTTTSDTEDQVDAEASQCIWLARVRPEDVENIVRYTVLQGKVVKPQRQLRGGFDRGRGLVSW